MIRLPKYPKFGAGDQAMRIHAIASRCGLDLRSFAKRSCVVTGSNGKGSTAAMLASILSAAGKRTGRFTSPHLFAINERFSIDGRDISDDALDVHWRRIEAAADSWVEAHPGQALGGFEFLFLIAASWFAQEQCDWTVWEAGIGGRHDVTRFVEPKFAALTSLDLEHTKLLGETLEEIALDKADICPPHSALFLGETAWPFLDAIAGRLAKRAARCLVVSPADLRYVPPLIGAHQRSNAAIAVMLAEAMIEPTPNEIADGLAQTRWPGRLERIHSHPPIVIDVGHTPAAVAAALSGFRQVHSCRDSLLVCGASADKDARAIVDELAPHFDRIVATCAHHKGLPAEAIAVIASDVNPRADLTALPLHEAHRAALLGAGERAVYVAGGLFLAVEFKAVHQGLDPAMLAFF